ncbi:hypothetical protein [Nocardia cyriacigeorgica]|uniref:hypothetical protein n=1 Tax=Nocardia cyriacigeorgica TaxID=135487 RepID=UPI0024549C19|nr:hypothetical protein [Nocardia cyriacigeorgica]
MEHLLVLLGRVHRPVPTEQVVVNVRADDEIDESRAATGRLGMEAEHLTGFHVHPDPQRMWLTGRRRELDGPASPPSELDLLHVSGRAGEVVALPVGGAAALHQELVGSEVMHAVERAGPGTLRVDGEVPGAGAVGNEDGATILPFDAKALTAPPHLAAVPDRYQHLVRHGCPAEPGELGIPVGPDLANRPVQGHFRNGGERRQNLQPGRHRASLVPQRPFDRRVRPPATPHGEQPNP